MSINVNSPLLNVKSDFEIPNKKTLCQELSAKIEAFQQRQGIWITPHCQHIQEGNVHFYGIHKNQQLQMENGNVSYVLTRGYLQGVKSHILQSMQLPMNTKVIQVVGDSAPFSFDGTQQSKAFLRAQLPADSLILYGYTGHGSNGTCCVNASVTDVIQENNLQGHVVANFVGYHTSVALTEWGCTGPELQYYVVVYGDDESSRETGTMFGDDVVTSDFFADSLLLLEGGAQSFRQVCNALLQGQTITVLSGLREPSKAFAKEMVESVEILTPYFTSASFLGELRALVINAKGTISEPELQEWYQNYFGRGKCYVGDPSKGDYETKHRLLNDAWSLFTKERLYLKIDKLVV